METRKYVWNMGKIKFNGIKDLYGNNKNVVISTDGLKQITDNYITSELHIE